MHTFHAAICLTFVLEMKFFSAELHIRHVSRRRCCNVNFQLRQGQRICLPSTHTHSSSSNNTTKSTICKHFFFFPLPEMRASCVLCQQQHCICYANAAFVFFYLVSFLFFVIPALIPYLEKIKFALLLGLNIERVAKIQPYNLSLRRCN